MTTRRLSVLAAILALAGFAASAVAGIPDPSLSTVPNVIASPGGTIPYNVTIVGQGGPVASANVQLRYAVAGDTSACWCVGQVRPVIAAVTNASGIATFNVSGGLCLNPALLAGGVAVEVFVNDIKLKEVGQISPDVVATPSGACEVGLNDAVSFTTFLATSTYSFCYDINSDGAVGLTDAVLFTSPAASAANCTEQ
ncbi:MAG: hypothetical protein SGI90_09950 [Candidatus Eisenbacteria bacterium]|nr:hypothetical protein [Candidatus Eisenbacteria bacterium]